jgi:two-component system, chemotaxis family, protein-glutamate methylesterase/glutaminase
VSDRDIVVIGASAGGVKPMRELVAGLSPELPAALFGVIHGSRHDGNLPSAIRDDAALPVRFARAGDGIEHGALLLAPPDRHLILGETAIRISRGPPENLWRPSIDVLFRSAAIEHGARTIGVVLSGALDDGTAGIAAICACGGMALVQDPAEASFPEMPESVLRNVDGIRVARSASLAPTLLAMLREPIRDRISIPPALRFAARVAEEPLESRRDIESSLWSAIRLFQQRSNLDRASAQKESMRGHLHGADLYAMRAAEAESHASVLYDLLRKLPD